MLFCSECEGEEEEIMSVDLFDFHWLPTRRGFLFPPRRGLPIYKVPFLELNWNFQETRVTFSAEWQRGSAYEAVKGRKIQYFRQL